LGGGREGSHTKTFPPNKIILINWVDNNFII
jgi:hypothetical protein